MTGISEADWEQAAVETSTIRKRGEENPTRQVGCSDSGGRRCSDPTRP